MHSKTFHRRAGFSLIEIVVGGAILLLLAGVGTPLVSKHRDQAKIQRAQADCDAIVQAIVRYKAEHGQYPAGAQGDPTYNFQAPDGDGLSGLGEDFAERPAKFMSRQIGLDPWGKPYAYHIYTKTNPYQDVVAYSTGPDMRSQSWGGSVWNTGSFAGDDIGAMHDE